MEMNSLPPRTLHRRTLPVTKPSPRARFTKIPALCKHSQMIRKRITHITKTKNVPKRNGINGSHFPQLRTILLHRTIQAQSETYTCEIPLATLGPLVHSKIKATSLNKHFHRGLTFVGYSLIYTPMC